jgi:hypothetical protein
MSITAIDARRSAMIFEMAVIPPLPKTVRILDEALKESQTIIRLTTKERMVGTTP